MTLQNLIASFLAVCIVFVATLNPLSATSFPESSTVSQTNLVNQENPQDYTKLQKQKLVCRYIDGQKRCWHE